MGDLIELIQQATDRFEMFSMPTELVRAYEGPDGKKMFKGIASSTTKDLHGDTITLSALQDMERTAVGLTMFLNHKYDVPDDVGGTITRAIVKQKGVDDKGDPAYVLEIEGEVEDDNPEALKTYNYVKKGRKIGLSIGAMIPDGGAKRQKDGSYVIEHLQLLEVSFVGIPANPKSWVEYAASALRGLEKRAQTATLGGPTITLDTEKGQYEIRGSLGDLKLDLGEPAVALGKDGQPLVVGEPEIDWAFAWDRDNKVEIRRSVTTLLENGMAEMSVESLGSWDLADPDQKLAAMAMAGEAAIQKATVWVETRDGDKITIGDPPDATASVSSTDPAVTATIEPDVTDAGCPTCGGSKGSPKGDCSNDYHAAAPDPDVTDAKVRIIEVDTDDSSGDGQGASSSEPDGSGTEAGATPDATAAAEPVILDGQTTDQLLRLSFDQLQSAALATLRVLDETKRLYDVEKAARIKAEKDAEVIKQTTAEFIKDVQRVLDKVADAPLTRKAVAIEAKTYSASIEQLYGEELTRALTSGQ